MLALIQARMSSSRLPGKVLSPIADKPILAWVVERIRQASTIDAIAVVTSKAPEDDAVEDYCASHGIDCCRGPLHDVAGRFAQAIARYRPDAFFRVCADSPLLDPRLLDYGAQVYYDQPVDLVTNVLMRRFPAGQSVELIRSAAFRTLLEQPLERDEREHVTTHFYRHPHRYRIASFTSPDDYSHMRHCVDTEADLHCVKRLIDASNGLPGTWEQLVELEQGWQSHADSGS